MDRGSALLRDLPRWTGWLALSAVSGLLAVAWVALVIAVRQVADTRQPLFDALTPICGLHTLGQSFVATAPNLDRIDLWLAWSPSPQEVQIATPVLPPDQATPDRSSHSDQIGRYRLFLPIIVRSPDVLNTQGCDLASSDGSGVITVSLKAAPTSAAAIAWRWHRSRKR